MVKGFHILAAWLLLNAAAFGQAFTFHDTAFVGLIAQPGVTPTNYAAFYFTTTGAATGTIAALTVTSAMDVDWGDGTTNSYTGSGARTHNYAGAGTWQVRLMTPALVTALTLSDNKITLNSSEIAQCTNMVTFQATGLKAGTFNSTDVSAWRPTDFRLYSMPDGYAGTFDSTDVSAWRPTYFYLYSMPAGYAGTFDSTDVSAWRPTYFRLYSMPAGYAGTFDSTDVSAWRPTFFRLYSMPAGYAVTITSGGFAGWTNTIDLNLSGNSLSQASVDQVLADCYTAFAIRTATGGTITLGGNNITPSGTLQAQCPPTTGKEFAYELVNDSCGTNTTKKWTTVTLSTNLPTDVAFSDDFNRADAADLGTNWTVLSGTISNQVNKASSSILGYTNMAVTYVTNTGTVDQYVKITIDGALRAGRGIYPKLIFRINGTNEHFNVEFHVNEDLVKWNYFTNSAGNTTTITSTAATVDDTDTWGVTVTGTGTGTVVRCWRNPTGLPTAVDNWDGDTTPDVSFTDDPAVACDSGLQVGFGGAASDAADLRWEDFTGGGL